MATYSVSLGHNYTPPNTADAAEAAEEAAATPLEHWLGWLEAMRDEIDQADGDPDDLDNLLGLALEFIAGGGPDAVAVRDERVAEAVREVTDLRRKVARQQREAREEREERTVEAKALTERLDGLANAVAAVTRENVELRATLANCEQNLTQATNMLEREIAKERSLRRLLDAQRSRPHTQRVASELAKRHAAKMLEAATKSKTEAA
jgi:chromosome segregation ATPase